MDGKGGTDTTKDEDKKDGNCVNTAFLSGADASIRGSGVGAGEGGGRMTRNSICFDLCHRLKFSYPAPLRGR